LMSKGEQRQKEKTQDQIKLAETFDVSDFQYETIDEDGNKSYQVPQFPESITSPAAEDVRNKRQFSNVSLQIKEGITKIRSESKDIADFENKGKALISGFVEAFADQDLAEVGVQLADYGNGILLENLTDANIKINAANLERDAAREIKVFSENGRESIGLVGAGDFSAADKSLDNVISGLIENNKKNPLNDSKTINDAVDTITLQNVIAMGSKLATNTNQPIATLLFLQNITRTGEYLDTEYVASNLIASGISKDNANIFANRLSKMSSLKLAELEREFSKTGEDLKSMQQIAGSQFNIQQFSENPASANYLSSTEINNVMPNDTFRQTILTNPGSEGSRQAVAFMQNAPKLPNSAQSFYGNLLDGKLEAESEERVNVYLQDINQIHTNYTGNRIINSNKGLSPEQAAKLVIINTIVDAELETPKNAIALANQFNPTDADSIALQKQNLNLPFDSNNRDIDSKIIALLDDVLEEDNVAFVHDVLPLAKMALSMQNGKVAILAMEGIVENHFPKTDLIKGYSRSADAPEQYMGEEKDIILDRLSAEVLIKTNNQAGIRRFRGQEEGDRSLFGRDSEYMLMQDPRTKQPGYFVVDQTGQVVNDFDGNPIMYNPRDDRIKQVMERRMSITDAINAAEASRYQIMLQAKRPEFDKLSTAELQKLLKRGTRYGIPLAERVDIDEEESAFRREIIRGVLRERGAY